MMIDQNPISVVICAYTQERWDDLKQAIQSVQAQTVKPQEVLLVIDHNPELFSLATDSFPEIKVIENQEARGLSGARNTGYKSSTGRTIVFMDEDAVAAPDWLENLLNSYNDPGVIGVGGEVRPQWTDGKPVWFPEEFNWVVGCSYKGLPESLAPVRNPIGCNMSFRHEVLFSSGGFRNGMGRVGTVPVGCEETELTIRLRQHIPDAVYLYQPAAVVYHKVPLWRTSWSYFTRRCFAEGISKASVSRFVGSEDGLSSERNYIIRTLVLGFFRRLGKAIIHLQSSGVKQAFSIAYGLSMTTAGYLYGVISLALQNKLPGIRRQPGVTQTKRA